LFTPGVSPFYPRLSDVFDAAFPHPLAHLTKRFEKKLRMLGGKYKKQISRRIA
jgi:hypothetical protein